jgi:RHS repeat-associated core domain
MTQKQFANGVSTDLIYDGWSMRLANIYTPGLQDINYSFDEKGNVIGITDNISNENQYFFYDDLDRLLLAGSENYTQSFAYNSHGSILAHRSKDKITGDEVVFGFEYGNGAGIHAPTRVSDMELLYDANGNLIEDGSFTYTYNDANQLVKVTKKSENRVIAEFFYDESGNRVKKVEDGVVSYYITKDYDIEDGEETVYYYANGNRVARNSDEGTFWYLDDHLGSTNVMTDADGELVERTLYYPFGSFREGGTEKYTFTGKEFDSEIGLYYYGARYYNPQTFVFTQADTIIPDVYYPQSLNRYAYCYNNPLKYDDPDGHIPVLLATAIAGAIVGAAVYATVSAVTQYAETGHVDLKEVGKEAIVGGVVGGIVGLTCGAGTAVAGGSIAGAAISEFVFGGFVSVGTGIAERGTRAMLHGSGAIDSLVAAFDVGGDAILKDWVVGSVSGGLLGGGSTLLKNSAKAVVKETTKDAIKESAENAVIKEVTKTSSTQTAKISSTQTTKPSTISTIVSGAKDVTNALKNSVGVGISTTISATVNFSPVKAIQNSYNTVKSWFS